ncbi:hypothetical protein V8F33_007809 [Rhypophila sp. PSN 637]
MSSICCRNHHGEVTWLAKSGNCAQFPVLPTPTPNGRCPPRVSTLDERFRPSHGDDRLRDWFLIDESTDLIRQFPSLQASLWHLQCELHSLRFFNAPQSLAVLAGVLFDDAAFLLQPPKAGPGPVQSRSLDPHAVSLSFKLLPAHKPRQAIPSLPLRVSFQAASISDEFGFPSTAIPGLFRAVERGKLELWFEGFNNNRFRSGVFPEPQ